MKKSIKIFWVRRFYHENQKESDILETLLWIYICSYNTTIVFLHIIPYYSQQIWKILFYRGLQCRIGLKITVFIKNKIIYIRRFTLHCLLAYTFFLRVLYFDLNLLAALCCVSIWLVKKCNWRSSAHKAHINDE